jgi:hypothetical protein
MSNFVVEYAVGPNVGASWSRYGHADIGAGIWKAGNVGSVVQCRVFGEIVNDEDVLGVVRRGQAMSRGIIAWPTARALVGCEKETVW